MNIIQRIQILVMKKKGFTLIEVILSLAIFGIIAIVMISLFSFNYRTIFLAGDKSEKIFSAQSKIEREIYDDSFKLNENQKEEKEVRVTGDIETSINGDMIKIIQDHSYGNQSHNNMEMYYFHVAAGE